MSWYPLYVISVIYKLCVNHFILYQLFHVVPIILFFLSVILFILSQSFYMRQPFYFDFIHVINSLLFHIIENVDSRAWSECIWWIFSLRKIAKTLAHLATRARGLGGEDVKLLSREVLGKLMQHVHRMIVWMTLSTYQHVWRSIQVPKFQRREVVKKRLCENDSFQGVWRRLVDPWFSLQ
jgi:hypothetical protein